MHFYFLTRGIKGEVEDFIKHMETRYFPLDFIDNEGKPQKTMIQGALRPIQLWEYVAPETSKDLICSTLKFDEQAYKGIKNDAMLLALRKVLGAKKPKFNKLNERFLLPNYKNIHLAPIGIREDKLNWTAPDGKTHEAL
jgi:hypothetical protein